MSPSTTANGGISKRNFMRLSSSKFTAETAESRCLGKFHGVVNTPIVGAACSIFLLRIRARYIRTEYVRMQRCCTSRSVQPFINISPEGAGCVL